MSSPALRAIPQVNLDDFERRIRAATAAPSAYEDPLAELARLVGLDGPPQRLAENVVALAPRAQQSAEPPAFAHEPLIRVSYKEARSVPVDPPQLRPSIEDEAEQANHEEFHQTAAESHHFDDNALDEAAALMAARVTADRSRSSGRWLATVSLLSLLGIVGVGAALALKYGVVPGLHKAPPVIMASAIPTKVAPPSTDTVAPNDNSSTLFKEPSAKPAPVKVVSNEEQPVDLRTQGVVQATASATAATSAAPVVAPRETASPIASNPNAPVVATPEAGPVAGASVASPLFAEPKRVKTVSVRPDGTVISTSSEAKAAPANSAVPGQTRSVAAAPTPTPSAEPVVEMPTAQPATPKLDLPVKPHAKSTARVPVAKTETTGVATDAPLQLGPPTKLEKAAKTARTKAGAPVKAAAPAAVEPAATPPADPAPTAAINAPGASSGGYAVQLAAPGSQQEAQSAASRLKSKYSSELSGLDLTIHQADVAKGPVYRVRVGDLSKAAAVALCEKLKASGGACFVAKN